MWGFSEGWVPSAWGGGAPGKLTRLGPEGKEQPLGQSQLGRPLVPTLPWSEHHPHRLCPLCTRQGLFPLSLLGPSSCSARVLSLRLFPSFSGWPSPPTHPSYSGHPPSCLKPSPLALRRIPCPSRLPQSPTITPPRCSHAPLSPGCCLSRPVVLMSPACLGSGSVSYSPTLSCILNCVLSQYLPFSIKKFSGILS